MKTTLLTLNVFALIASIIWLITEKSWEPLISAIGLIVSLITLLYSSNKDSSISMKQNGGKKSTNYQAGDTLNVNYKNDKR